MDSGRHFRNRIHADVNGLHIFLTHLPICIKHLQLFFQLTQLRLFHIQLLQLPVQLFRLSQQLRRLTPKLLKLLFLLLSRSRFQSYTIPIFLKIRCQRFLQLIIPFTQLLKFSPKSEYHILTASLILALFHEFMDILNLIFIQNCLLLILQTIHIGFQLLHSAFSAAG